MAYNGEEGKTKLVDVAKIKAKKLKKHILFITAILIIVSIAIIASWLIFFKDKPSINVPLELSQSQIASKLTEINEARFAEDSKKANSIVGIDDLKKYSDEEQAVVGSIIMSNAYANKEYEKLRIFAEYFSVKGGSISIDALKFLYLIENDTYKKAEWRNKLNIEARKQGIVGESEVLPDSYFINREGQ